MNTANQENPGCIVFTHSDLDDAELSVYAFRIYCRIARRAGCGKGCYESTPHMADGCQMSRKRASRAIKELQQRRMIRVDRRPGQTNMITLTDRSEWILPTPVENTPGDNAQGESTPGENDRTPRAKTPDPPRAKTPDKGNPYEGYPIKGTTLYRPPPFGAVRESVKGGPCFVLDDGCTDDACTDDACTHPATYPGTESVPRCSPLSADHPSRWRYPPGSWYFDAALLTLTKLHETGLLARTIEQRCYPRGTLDEDAAREVARGWADTFRRLVELDGYTRSEVGKAMRYLFETEDEFYHKNRVIRSVPPLRHKISSGDQTKFDSLFSNMQSHERRKPERTNLAATREKIQTMLAERRRRLRQGAAGVE